MKSRLAAFVSGLLLATAASAEIIYVSFDGSEEYTSIQAAIDASSDGDEIRVKAGIYTDAHDGFIVNTKGKAITLKSINGDGAAVIDGGGQWRGCSFTSGETNATVLDGFTIRDCNAIGNAVNGGAIWCHGGSPSILNCIITGNVATGYGAGICCYENSAPIISGCTITNNTGITEWGCGAGISAFGGGAAPVISNCLISGNHATLSGGGMRLGINLPPIRDCIISNNTSDQTGGAVNIDSGTQEFINCVFVGNIAAGDGGAVFINSSASKFLGCQFTNNQAARGGAIHVANTPHGPGAILDGCTVSGNAALISGGGGIKAEGRLISLANTVISDNTALGSGGGLDCLALTATITGCEFSGNTVTGSKSYGGAMRLYLSAGTISDCTIEGNHAAFWGGGISLYDSPVSILRTQVLDNSTDQVGGGIAVQNSAPMIVGCTISGNTATSYGGGLRTSYSDVSLVGNDFCTNSPDDIGGDWVDLDGNQFTETCPVYEGACCTNGGCVQVQADDCSGFLGNWLGAGSSCDDCPPVVEPEDTGACCVQGYCSLLTEDQCFDLSGSYAGDDVTCEDAGCPVNCSGDINGDGQVGIVDILTVIDRWGLCP
ncbi:MAG: right-handed parallel beta-helix repeat-containing protein [Phycisphaerales bacterium]|nr:right-handed parallel beta-helix repeat-containing protein [Phycisphaerales bacterium]